MDGAVYALIVNICVAGLFAVAFAVIRLSYRDQREVMWFCAMYVVGMGTPLAELGVRFTPWADAFTIVSYGSFLSCVALTTIAISALAGQPKPWRTAVVILIGGIAVRAAIWGGTRNDLTYELLFQSPFAIGTAVSAAIAAGTARRRGGGLWLALAIVFSMMSAHFVAKPFFAAAFGSGGTAREYASSAYGLFSQATGGVLIVMAGLLILLLVVQSAMGRTIRESETDPLTGIDNRRGFERKANRMIADAQSGGEPLVVAVFDLDHFKQVNDGYGHATGDAVIRAFAELLRRALPPTAAVARLGGEEFAALIDRTTLRGGWLAAQAVRNGMPGLGSHLPPVTVSGGLAEMVEGDTLATLLERADLATYAAKRAGRNRIEPAVEPVTTTPRLTLQR